MLSIFAQAGTARGIRVMSAAEWSPIFRMAPPPLKGERPSRIASELLVNDFVNAPAIGRGAIDYLRRMLPEHIRVVADVVIVAAVSDSRHA